MTVGASSPVAFEQARVGFDPDLHRYTFEGEPVVNVTRLLRDYRISADWSHVPAAELEAKRQLGQAVHAATHYLDEGTLDRASVQAPLVPYLEAWERATRELALEILLVETRLVHPLKRFGGTVDRFAIAHALQRPEWGHFRPSIVDLKTGDPEDAGTGPQTAAYEEMLRAVLDPDLIALLFMRSDLDAGWRAPWVRYSIQLLPTGAYKLHTYTSPRDGHRFNWALSLEASAHPSWRARP